MSPRRQADSAIRPLACRASRSLSMRGFVVEALQEGGRDQLDEVAVALLVLAQQDQVVVAVGVGADLEPLLGDVDFAADDRVDAFFAGGMVELHGSEQVAVAGERHRGHAQRGHLAHELWNGAGPVQQRIIGVAMQVDKRSLGHSGYFSMAPAGRGRGARRRSSSRWTG